MGLPWVWKEVDGERESTGESSISNVLGDGLVFFMGLDGMIQIMGAFDSYKSQVRNAGY